MLTNEGAESLAITALGWLVGQEDLIDIFMGSTGASQDDLRQGVAEPHFLGAVMDFILLDDQWVMRFCDDKMIAYDALMSARQHLPGGEQVHWT